MLLTVKVFAAAKQVVGASEVAVEVPEDCDVATLKNVLCEKFPELQPMVVRSNFAIDQRYAADDLKLSAENEIAFIPPVSGG